MSAHFAGIRQEQYRIYQPDMIKRDWEMLVRGKYDAASVINNYDNGVVQADAMIRQLFADLQRKGYMDNSLVVILADHGEGLGERSGAEGFGHARLLYQEFIRIPLLIYDDSKTEYANLKFATQIDVAPTIVARLGLSIPASWQGQSLLDPDSSRYEFHQTQGRVPSYAILFRTQGAIYKYFYRTWDGVGIEELYELNSDPGETHNLFSSADPSLIKHLRAKLEEYLARS